MLEEKAVALSDFLETLQDCLEKSLFFPGGL